MRTKFKLASGPLSYLGEVHIDLEMKGKHFDELIKAEEGNYERAALSVLADLMDEDPFQLTLSELYHLFLYVKVTSLSHKLSLQVRCRNVLQSRDGISRECGHLNSVEYSLVESDVNYCPKNYKVPEIKFSINGEERVYEVRPPTMTQELYLLDYFQERGVARESLLKDKEMVLEFAKHRILLHLKGKDAGEGFIDRAQREAAVKEIAENPISFMEQAGIKMGEVNAFGISHKRMNLICKECGGSISYRLPLSAGISM